jgi:Animal haem peroxidase
MPGSCSSGYAYLGQFITHDLSRVGTKMPDYGKEKRGKKNPKDTPNERTACLDLEPLYGNPPKLRRALRKGPRLCLGPTLASDEFPSTENDLPRKEDSTADIPDERNDVTLLLAQLHVLLIKFHNRIVDDLCSGNIPVAGPDHDSLFARAKRLVTWHYQWIVRYDFLPKLVGPDVLQDIAMTWPKWYRPHKGQASIPVEFAWAAFQYGHSAVQNSYNINRHVHRLPVEDTFCLTGGHRKPHLNLTLCNCKESHTRLPQEYVVDPGRMFGWRSPGISNVSEEIDTLVSGAFYKLSAKTVRLYANDIHKRNGGPPQSLPEITFLRGNEFGLPSGQEACRFSGVQTLPADDLAHTQDLKDFLETNGLDKSTPLFYYILREAEVAGRAAAWGRPCKRLGPLGSRIVAEVILGVLNADPHSFIHYNWRPPVIRLACNRTIRLDSLKKLALYASGYEA